MKTLLKLSFVAALILTAFSMTQSVIDSVPERETNNYNSSELASIDWSDYNYSSNKFEEAAKCGNEKKKTEEAKKAKGNEMKCAPGKCGEGKCGNSNKVEKAEHKCGEGKCGEGKNMPAKAKEKADSTLIKK